MKSSLFNSSIYWFIFTLCLSIVKNLQAQTDTTSVIDLEEIVITATKTSVNRNNVSMTISVVPLKQIESSSESALLPVLTQQVPGLFVTERGITGFGVSTGSAGQISIRGIGGSPNTQVLVLVNGNPQFMGIMGHPLPDAYVASDVERVEVIRGPASTLYGTNAMGGVINIITRKQIKDGIEANARIMYGSYNTQKYMVNGGFKKNKFSVFASYNHDKTDGHRDSSDFGINNGYVRMDYDINQALSVHADFSLAGFRAADPGMEGSVAGNTIDILRGMGAFRINNTFIKSDGSLRFYYNFGEHKITDGFHSKDNNFGFVVYQSFNLFKGNTFTIGADYKKYGGIAENVKAMNGQGIIFGDTASWELSGYIYLHQQLSEKLFFSTGFRLEHNSVYGNEPVPTGGFAFHPTSNTTIKASVSKGFRSPTLRELYLWTPANANLKPERVINYEIGVLQTFIKNRLSMELTGFRVNGDNLILTVMKETGPLNENSGSFSNTGLEFAATFKPLGNIAFNANYSYIDMKEPIVATPEQQVNLGGTYTWKNLSVDLSLQHIHNLYTKTSPEINKNSYTVLDSKVSFTVSKYIDVFLKGENLTNRKYYINFGYPMPGIVAFGGMNLHY